MKQILILLLVSNLIFGCKLSEPKAKQKLEKAYREMNHILTKYPHLAKDIGGDSTEVGGDSSVTPEYDIKIDTNGIDKSLKDYHDLRKQLDKALADKDTVVIRETTQEIKKTTERFYTPRFVDTVYTYEDSLYKTEITIKNGQMSGLSSYKPQKIPRLNIVACRGFWDFWEAWAMAGGLVLLTLILIRIGLILLRKL